MGSICSTMSMLISFFHETKKEVSKEKIDERVFLQNIHNLMSLHVSLWSTCC